MEAAATIVRLDNCSAPGRKDAHLAEPEPGYGWEVFLAERPCRSLVPGKGGKVRDPETVFQKPIL